MVMALFGTVLGMILEEVGIGSALVLSLKDQGSDGVAIPWVLLGGLPVLTAIAGVLAAIWPAWRASRLRHYPARDRGRRLAVRRRQTISGSGGEEEDAGRLPGPTWM